MSLTLGSVMPHDARASSSSFSELLATSALAAMRSAETAVPVRFVAEGGLSDLVAMVRGMQEPSRPSRPGTLIGMTSACTITPCSRTYMLEWEQYVFVPSGQCL